MLYSCWSSKLLLIPGEAGGGEADEAHNVSKTNVLNSLHSKTSTIVFFGVQLLFVTVNSSKDQSLNRAFLLICFEDGRISQTIFLVTNLRLGRR